ncbi:MAG TPA: alpha/beta fold hydrolase [Myxococcota bacterium]|nr:alpha/beta fold hydrolase [Myxococcota bacterium]
MAFAGREIELTSDGEKARAYLALPPRGRGPGVIVIQEWWGLVDHIREVCDRLAREGFVALAPDLYRGEATGDPGVAGRLMMDLALPRAARDLEAAITTLVNHEAVNGGKVAVIGFCMGGQLALYAASLSPRISAVVDCYGVHPNVRVDYAKIRAAVMGVFAERDAFVPPETAHQLEADLRAAGVRTDFTIFAGVDHAFLNDSRPDVYDAATAQRAWGRILSFLRAGLA